MQRTENCGGLNFCGMKDTYSIVEKSKISNENISNLNIDVYFFTELKTLYEFTIHKICEYFVFALKLKTSLKC